MGIDRILSPDPNPELARDLSILIHRTQREPSRRGTTTTTTRRLPSAAKVKRPYIRADDGAARERALVGDALDDE